MKRDEPGGLLLLEIEPEHLKQVVQDARPGWKPELIEQLDVRDPQIELLITAMLEDLRNASPAGRLYGESLGTALAIYLAHRYASLPSTPPAYKGGIPPARLKRVLQYIDANLHENLKLSDLASVAGISLYHFAKLFKQSTAVSPHQFVLRRRIERAKAIAESGDECAGRECQNRVCRFDAPTESAVRRNGSDKGVSRTRTEPGSASIAPQGVRPISDILPKCFAG